MMSQTEGVDVEKSDIIYALEQLEAMINEEQVQKVDLETNFNKMYMTEFIEEQKQGDQKAEMPNKFQHYRYPEQKDDIVSIAQEVLKLVQKREELFKHSAQAQALSKMGQYSSPNKDRGSKSIIRSRQSSIAKGKFARSDSQNVSPLHPPDKKRISQFGRVSQIHLFGQGQSPEKAADASNQENSQQLNKQPQLRPRQNSNFSNKAGSLSRSPTLQKQLSFQKHISQDIKDQDPNSNPSKQKKAPPKPELNLDPHRERLRDNLLDDAHIKLRKIAFQQKQKQDLLQEKRKRRDRAVYLHNLKVKEMLDKEEDQQFRSVIERMMIYEEKKKQRLKAISDLQKKQEESNVLKNPVLNKKSLAIALDKKLKPIHQRTGQILKEKKEKLNMAKKIRDDQISEIEEHITFIPNYKSVMERLEKEELERQENMYRRPKKGEFDGSKSIDFVFEDPNDVNKSLMERFLIRQQEHEIKQRVNLKRVFYRELNNEMKEVIRAPRISSRSKTLAQKRIASTSRDAAVEQRLFIDAKEKELRLERLQEDFVTKNYPFQPSISQLPDFVLEHRLKKLEETNPDNQSKDYTNLAKLEDDMIRKSLKTPARGNSQKKHAHFSSFDDPTIDRRQRPSNDEDIDELMKTVDRLENLAYQSGMTKTVAYKDHSKEKDRDFHDNVFLKSFKDFAVDVAEPDAVRPTYIQHRSGKMESLRSKMKSNRSKKRQGSSSQKRRHQSKFLTMDSDDSSTSFLMNTLKKR